MTREELEARMAESARTVDRIRSEWEAEAKAGNAQAARLLWECFGVGSAPELVLVDQPMLCGHADEGWEAFPCTEPKGHIGEHVCTTRVSLRPLVHWQEAAEARASVALDGDTHCVDEEG